MKRSPRRWLYLISICVALALTTAMTAIAIKRNSEKTRDDKIMMYAGDGLFGEPFDATRWFADGMYQRLRYSDGRPGFRMVGMRRVSPPPFADLQLSDLRMWISEALATPDESSAMAPVPDAAVARVRDPAFDPRPQIIYISSGFDAADEPRDNYIFYMLHEGKRYFVYMNRGPIDGRIVSSWREVGLIGIDDDKEESLFAELDEKEERAARLGAPGLRARSGQPCPHPGLWECLECSPKSAQSERIQPRAAIAPGRRAQCDMADAAGALTRSRGPRD